MGTWAEYKVKEQAKADKLKGQYRQRRRMLAASTHPRIEALQMKLMQERAEILASHPEYDTWAEYKVKEQAKVDGQYRIKAIQKKLMQARAEILARHPEYATWKEYLAKEQAKADKLKGQYHGRRRMPAASIMEKLRKIMEQRAATRARTYGGQLEASRNAPRRTPSPQTSSAINAIHMKLQQERAATRARTYGGQLEASRNAPRRTPSPQT